MANYESVQRSNYFDPNLRNLALLETLFDIQVVHKPPLAAIIARETSLDIVSEDQTDLLYELGIVDADNIDTLDLLDVIHLATTDTLVWMKIGNEKARYLVGWATRIDANGQILAHINFDDSYLEGETRCAY